MDGSHASERQPWLGHPLLVLLSPESLWKDVEALIQ